MPVEKITKTVWRCTCEFPDCVGIDPKTRLPRPWDSKDEKIPDSCSWCKRRNWHGRNGRSDLRYNAPEVKWVTFKTKGGTTRVRKQASGVKDHEPGQTPETRNLKPASRKTRARPTIHLPKPKKVRPAED